MSDVIPGDILNQAMDDHDAKTEKHEPKAAVLQAAKSGVLKSTNQAMHGDEAKDKQDVPDFWATHTHAERRIVPGIRRRDTGVHACSRPRS